jgi:hypothetical protein
MGRNIYTGLVIGQFRALQRHVQNLLCYRDAIAFVNCFCYVF